MMGLLSFSRGVYSGELCSSTDFGDGEGSGEEAGVVPRRGVAGCDATFASSEVAFVGLPLLLSRRETVGVQAFSEGAEMVEGVSGGRRCADFWGAGGEGCGRGR